MGEIFVEGPDALAYLQKIVTNDVSKIAIGGHNIPQCAMKMAE